MTNDKNNEVLKDSVFKRIVTHEQPLQSANNFIETQFQQRVELWFRECFSPAICNDKLERGDRLLEEVLELLQSGDYPPERVAALVDYTWNRPKGKPLQEVGGVMVTMAAYCIAHQLDMHKGAELELTRINKPKIIQKIRAKQAQKPTGSALPVSIHHQEAQNNPLPKIGKKGHYVYKDEDIKVRCYVISHIEGWLEVEFLADKSTAIIRPSRFIAL